jgi:predicted RNase H-like nuclease (RuvC/YqgF family)
MAKKYEREEDLVDRLEKENRELKATIRSLERRLKKVDKDFRKEMEDVQKEHLLEKEHSRSVPKGRKCEHCGKGHIIEIDIVGRKFESCDTCDYRKKINGKG